MEKLEDIRDIKPIFDISDYYFYIAMAALAVAGIAAVLFFLYRFFKKKKDNIRANNIKKLKNIDFSDPKSCAYDMTKYLRLVAVNESEKTKANEIVERLQEYKYVKNPPAIGDEIRLKYNDFLKALDERDK